MLLMSEYLGVSDGASKGVEAHSTIGLI